MQTIQISVDEYNNLLRQNQILLQNDLLIKINEVLDLLYENKYGLYLGDYTDDLTEFSMKNSFENGKSVWDEL